MRNAKNIIKEQTKLPEEASRTLANFTFEVSTDEETAKLETLIQKRKLGEGSVIISQNWKNGLVNWKDMLTKGVPAIVAMVAGFSQNPILGFFAAISAYQALIGIFEITISQNHAEVVRSLWIDKDSINPVIVDDLKQMLSGKLEDATINNVLDELADLGLIEFGGPGEIIKRDKIILR